MSFRLFRVLNKINPYIIRSGGTIQLEFDCRFKDESPPLRLQIDYNINGNGVVFDNGQKSQTKTFDIHDSDTHPSQIVKDNINLVRTNNDDNRITVVINASIPSGQQIDNINVDVLLAPVAVLHHEFVTAFMANMRDGIKIAVKEAVKGTRTAVKKKSKTKTAKKNK